MKVSKSALKNQAFISRFADTFDEFIQVLVVVSSDLEKSESAPNQ